MSRPPATATASVSPATRTGARRSVVEPSPSWPSEFSPQVHTEPSARSAIEKLCPVSTAMTSVRAVTCVGVDRFPVVPRPSWPSALEPHVQTVPSARSATTCSRPPWRSTTSSMPTGPGVRRAVVVPLPSCPYPLLPHVHGVPTTPVSTAAAVLGRTPSPVATPDAITATRTPIAPDPLRHERVPTMTPFPRGAMCIGRSERGTSNRSVGLGVVDEAHVHL